MNIHHLIIFLSTLVLIISIYVFYSVSIFRISVWSFLTLLQMYLILMLNLFWLTFYYMKSFTLHIIMPEIEVNQCIIFNSIFISQGVRIAIEFYFMLCRKTHEFLVTKVCHQDILKRAILLNVSSKSAFPSILKLFVVKSNECPSCYFLGFKVIY
jgi:hypothetical protein